MLRAVAASRDDGSCNCVWWFVQGDANQLSFCTQRAQRQNLFHPVSREIRPARVGLFDQRNFPFPGTILDLLFDADGFRNIIALLKPDQPGDVVLAGKAFNQVFFVFVYTTLKVSRDARVKGTVFFACQNIDAGCLAHHAGCLLWILRRRLRLAQDDRPVRSCCAQSQHPELLDPETAPDGLCRMASKTGATTPR